MILISDGWQSGATGGLEALANEIKADGVRIIALGFNGTPGIFTQTLSLITNEVFRVSLIF